MGEMSTLDLFPEIKFTPTYFKLSVHAICTPLILRLGGVSLKLFLTTNKYELSALNRTSKLALARNNYTSFL